MYVPLLLATVMFYIFEPVARFRSWFADWSYRNVWPMILLHLCFILYMAAASGLPGAPPDLIAPIPLHRRRLRRRGFNPAGLLARRLARRLDLPFDPVALVRLRDTPSQTGLDARERRRNVAGAFRVERREPIPSRVWLVDDVVTTGATLAAAARELRDAGVGSVMGVAAAATERRR